MWFKIVLNDDELETDFGVMTRGDVLESVDLEDDFAVMDYIYDSYTAWGIDVDFMKI